MLWPVLGARLTQRTSGYLDRVPFGFGLLPGDADEDVITGGMQGRGLLTRGQRGAIVGVELAGRLFTGVATASP